MPYTAKLEGTEIIMSGIKMSISNGNKILKKKSSSLKPVIHYIASKILSKGHGIFCIQNTVQNIFCNYSQDLEVPHKQHQISDRKSIIKI